MIAGPITDREYDPEKEKRLIRAAKKKMLEDLESDSVLGTGKLPNFKYTVVMNFKESFS